MNEKLDYLLGNCTPAMHHNYESQNDAKTPSAKFSKNIDTKYSDKKTKKAVE
jgi:hypothetical protein